DVILPCQVEPAFNVAGLTVEWSKPDLRPDPNDRLSRVEYVHLYRDAHEVPDMKLPSYIGRTALFTDSLRDGNISLRITNVTLEDQGRYRCFIPKLKGQTNFETVKTLCTKIIKKNLSADQETSNLIALCKGALELLTEKSAAYVPTDLSYVCENSKH
uniref:Ig-like domain-containing protein n=1 Tax=Neolamprologus brichardi TaxID=32507 RepID=A0A3Q4G4J0_NEOBR